MAPPKERKFAEMPEPMRLGPISLKNYDYRAEAHMAVHSEKRQRQHPIITRQSPEFPAWFEYFERHLSGQPWAFKALCEGKIREMTVPEPLPQWFDSSFVPTPGYRVHLISDEDPPNDPERNERMRAKFAQLLAGLCSKNSVVPRRKSFERYTKADLEALYRKHEGDAAEK